MNIPIGGNAMEHIQSILSLLPAVAILLVFTCVAAVAIGISSMTSELKEVREQYAIVTTSYMNSQLQIRRAHALLYAIFSQADDIDARDHDDPLKRAITEARAYYLTEVSNGGQWS